MAFGSMKFVHYLGVGVALATPDVPVGALVRFDVAPVLEEVLPLRALVPPVPRAEVVPAFDPGRVLCFG